MIILGIIAGNFFNFISPITLETILPFIFTLSILILLLESGLETQIFDLVQDVKEASIFTFIVLLITSLLTGAFMHFVIGWNILPSLLLGVICSGTSTLPVVYFTGRMNVNEKVKTLLVYESILNDVTLLTGVTLILQAITMQINIGYTLVHFFRHIFLGLIYGSISSIIWSLILVKAFRRVQLRYISTLSILLILYSITEIEHASGVIAVLAFSIILGGINEILDNSGLFHEEKIIILKPLKDQLKDILGMQREVSFVVKNLFFLVLGIMFDLNSLNVELVLISFFLMIIMAISRILSVGLISLQDRKYWNDVMIIALMLPRGVTASLAVFMPLEYGLKIPMLKEIIVVLIMVTTFTSTIGFIIINRESRKQDQRILKNIPLS